VKQARHWKHDDKVAGRVACVLCPHECVIAEGKAGRCLGRKNIGGELVAASYGEIVSIAVDPIEKTPLDYSSASSTAAEPLYEIEIRWDAPSLPYGAKA
jgi:hypothetical protein